MDTIGRRNSLKIVGFRADTVYTAHVCEKPLPGSFLLPAHPAHIHPGRVFSLDMTP